MATDVVIAVGTRGVSAAARSITRLEDRSSKFGKAMAGVVVGGAIAATAAIAKFGVASVQAASKAQQSIGATETVFGRYAKTVVRESNRADDALGLSANEYRELANVLGASLNAAGIPIRQTTGLTAKLNKRAADVAATFGGTTREAVESFGSALRGETDPIERYGVAIKEADVQARLAAKGQDKLEGKAGKTAAMMARLDLIFEQTSKSQGAFARESDTLAGAQQRLDAKIENVQARFGKLLLPLLTDGVNLISRKVIPAAEDLAGWFEKNSDEIGRTAAAVGDGLLPPLQTLGTIAAAVARVVADLPPEVQSLAAQAALAALVIPRLSSALTTARSTTTGYVASIRDAEKRTAALQNAARNAAGIGGMLLLAHGAQEASSGVRGLEMAAGGALTGLAVGGAWGAAIGAGGGLLASFALDSDKAAAAQDRLAAAQQRVIDTLNAQTGAYTKRTKAQLVDDMASKGMLETAKSLGLNLEQMADVTMRGTEAVYRWRTAMAGRTKTDAEATAVFNLAQNMLDMSAALQAGQRGWLLNAEAMGKNGLAAARVRSEVNQLGKRYRLLPREVRTIVAAMKVDDSRKSVQRLARQYSETPKTIRTIFRLVGAAEAQGQARNTRRALEGAGRAKPDTTPWLRGLETALTGGRQKASRGAEGVAKELRSGTRAAKAELGPFRSSLQNGINGARSTAATGGRGVGNALGQGMYGGVDAWAGPIASRAASIVSAAVAAAKTRGKIQSPSRVMRDEVGRQLGRGVAEGLRRSQAEVKVASFGIVQAVIEGLTGVDSSSPVDGAIGDVVSKVEQLYEDRLQRATTRIGSRFDALGAKVTAHFDETGKAIERREKRAEKKLRKTLKGKELSKALARLNKGSDRRSARNDAQQERAERALQKAQTLAEQKLTRENRAQRRAALEIVQQFTPALRANARAQAAINEQLEDARTNLAQLREQHASYVAQVRDNVVSFGSIIGLGEGTGFGSVDQMLGMMRSKVAQAREYAELIKSLTAAGLNETTIQQLIDAGVEGGIGTARALASGGDAAIREVNDLTAQLEAVGTDLGTRTADRLYGAGITAAEGLVAGLAATSETLAAQGRDLALRLDAALAEATALTARKNLEAGKGIGKNLAAGLLEGIDGNQKAVDKAARRLGNALVRKVKDELGIASPSRVFRGIGDNVVQGLDLGLDDTYVRRSGSQLAASLEKGFAKPRLEALLSTDTAGGHQTFTIRLTADQVSALSRGRQIQADLDAYRAAGGTMRAG